MDYRQHISELLAPALKGLGVERAAEELAGLVEVPKKSGQGDFAFPCFVLAKELRKAPPAIAADVVEALADGIEASAAITSAEAMGPYVNFRVNQAALGERLLAGIRDGSLLKPKEANNEKIMVEYSQPNTHKAMHVGHARCATLGDTLVRLFEFAGHPVLAANYIGDEGTHVARCLWYFQNHFEGVIPEDNLGEFLGAIYTQGTERASLRSLTRAPVKGVLATTVTSLEPHANPPEGVTWQVVGLSNGYTVICGGSGFAVGDWVAHKRGEDKDMRGTVSEGMILSEAELGLSHNNDQIAVLPPETEEGIEVAEIYKTENGIGSVIAEHEKRTGEIGEILAAIESQDPEIHMLWEKTKQWSMDDFYKIYEWLDCRFDEWFYESQFAESSKSMVREWADKGVFVESEGTIGADLKAEDIGFCILIKSNGTATYACRDLALASMKFEEFGIDRSVYVVDSAQSLHFKQVFRCLEKMGYAQAAKCHHHAYEQVMLRDGESGRPVKMSSRDNNVILFSALREGLTSEINEQFLDRFKDEWPAEELEAASAAIARASIRYGMLKQGGENVIVFDLKEWVSPKGNTGSYFLYTVARIRSILRKLGDLDEKQIDTALLTHPKEADVLLALEKYPDPAWRAAERYAPHLLCTYLYELAQKYNSMNADCYVLKAESEALKHTRAALHEAVAAVLAHGLGLLGIETIDRM